MSQSHASGSQISDPDEAPHRGRKRRRLNDHAVETADDYDLESDEPIASQTEEAAEEQDNEKPKSRHRIHIPKYQHVPTDNFLTQRPSRSPSPYRIGNFYWKKLQQPPSSNLQPQSAPITQQQPTSIVQRTDSRLSRAREQLSERSEPVQNDAAEADEFSDNVFDDIETDKLPTRTAVAFQPPEIAFEQPPARLKAPQSNLKQTTLFGTQAAAAGSQKQQLKRNWPLANRDEPPTHHKLDFDALKTWVYPTNLGTIREYQFGIVAKGLYHNMLVALPTGLGKTFIAATVMLNWFRWAPDSQIVFVAPTKPLVSQQVKACFEIAGIPRSTTSMLTGNTAPGIRGEEWQEKRVFFMTPQTIINDLKSGICDPKRLVLIVVDEAHRATGGYAYVEVIKFVKRFNESFRVLALTATPGASIETVQEVIDGLGISRIEIRTEESLDIRQYVHPRKVETMLFDYSDEMTMIMDLVSKALQPHLNKLNSQNAHWAKDPLSLTPFGCNQQRQKWMASDAGRNASWGLKSMINGIFSLLASLSHGILLLKFHGIAPFYHKMLSFRNGLSKGEKSTKYAKEVDQDPSFCTMMSRVQVWINSPDFIGHPKLEYVQTVVLNHFLDAGEGRGATDPASTRIMVFSHFRDSAEHIVRVLERNSPMIRPHVFVGQAASGSSEGMDQKKQNEIIDKFRSGTYNTLVATSIGEEGLDIGEVDLIICYDASASPIRMLQRMGRTGRKRTGKCRSRLPPAHASPTTTKNLGGSSQKKCNLSWTKGLSRFRSKTRKPTCRNRRSAVDLRNDR